MMRFKVGELLKNIGLILLIIIILSMDFGDLKSNSLGYLIYSH